MTTQRIALDRSSPFRRRRFVAPHRRKSSAWMLVRPFLTASLVVGIPVVALYWLSVTSRFDLQRIDILGARLVPNEQLASSLEPLRGRHLLMLSLDDVEALVRQSRWVDGATIRKELPDTLIVEIHEREPVALLRYEGDLYYVDRSGFRIEPYSPSGPVDLPLLTTYSAEDVDVDLALQVADRFARVAPDWGSGLSEIELLGEGDFKLHSATLEFPLLVSAETVEKQVNNLRSVLPQIEKRYQFPVTVDLRFSQQIVIQPAVLPRSEKG